MGLLYIDSFDHYDINTALYKWSSKAVVDIAVGEGRRGTNCAKMTPSWGEIIIGVDVTGDYVFGTAFYLPNSEARLDLFQELSSGDGGGILSIMADNSLNFWKGTYGGYMYLGGGFNKGMTSEGNIVKRDQWNYVEVKCSLKDDASGYYEVRLNGTYVMSFTGVTTMHKVIVGPITYINGFKLMGYNGVKFDDLYMLNSSGSFNTDFLGDVRIDPLYPNGADTSQWTPSTGGTNYVLVDEHVPDEADYVSTDTIGAKDLYAMDNTNFPAGTEIFGAQLLTLADKTDDGNSFIYNVVSSNGTESSKGPHGLIKDNFRYAIDCYDSNPDGNIQWTAATIDAVKCGFHLESE